MTTTEGPAVTVRLKGGLGNQMFCYAAAYALATRNGMKLILDDISGFARDLRYRREFALDAFRVSGTRISLDNAYTCPSRVCHALRGRLTRHRPFQKRKVLGEQCQNGIFSVDRRLVDIPLRRSVYLDGYWQSPAYFEDVQTELRERLTPVASLAPDREVLARQFRACASVGVGIRLFTDAGENSIHRVLDMQYYEAAMDRIASMVDQPHFYIFCDRPDLLAASLRENDRCTIIDSLTENRKAWEDLWLMAQCRHFIIGNSSFHWWAAWLGRNHGKIVIATPRGWLNEESLCPEWIHF